MSDAEARRDKPLILVVDDVEDGRTIVAEYLGFRGFAVEGAEDGLEAIQKAADLVPDLILMDVWLPKMDGLEATRRIKADARTRHIPVLALTAHALESAREKALDAGCDGVVTKPFFPADLEEEIRRHLGGGAGSETRRRR